MIFSETASASEVKNALDLAFGAGVIDSVSGDRGGPYQIKFAVGQGNVNELDASSSTGLTVRTQTLTDGSSSVAEVQELTFITTGRLVAAAAALRGAVAALPDETEGKAELEAKATELSDTIVSTNNIGDIVGDAIKGALDLPDDAFELTFDIVDADANATGFQPAALILLDIDKEVTETVGFDLDLPDLGPVTVNTGAEIDFTVGGHLDLDFGFRFDNFTPYLLNTTSFELSTSIDSDVSVSAGIAGITADLTGELELREAKVRTAASGATELQIAGNPIDDLIVVFDETRVFKQGVDFTYDTSTRRITFTSALTSAAEAHYALASETDGAGIDIGVNQALAPSDSNTIGGISFAQLVDSTPFSSNFDFNSQGVAIASLDANIAGLDINNAITVIASLDKPLDPQISFDGITNYLSGLTDLSNLSLSQIISGTRAVLSTVENGLKSDLLEQLPLIGENINLDQSFIGKLRSMIDELEFVINGSDSAIDALVGEVQQAIFNSIGPGGVDILALDPLHDNDPNVNDDFEIADFRDVDIFLSNPLTTPAEELELGINLSIAGRDSIDADFDLGVDALAFEFETSGGVELSFDYAFDLGFGISLQEGFFFQLNEDVTYDANGFLASGVPEISLNAEVNLKPGTTLAGELFFLELSATSNPIEDYNRDGVLTTTPLNEAVDGRDYNRDGDRNDILFESDLNGDGRLSRGTGLSGEIFIDIDNPDDSADNRLTFAELRSTSPKELFTAGIQTTAYADLGLAARTTVAGLPEITTDLTLEWGIGFNTNEGLVGGGLPAISLHDVTLDVGSFLNTVITPILESFDTYVGPIEPLIDFLAEPVPGLNDLSSFVGGPEITFLTLGILGATRTPQSIRLAQQAQKVVGLLQSAFDLADTIRDLSRDGDGIEINFGTFHLSGPDAETPNVDLTVEGAQIPVPDLPAIDPVQEIKPATNSSAANQNAAKTKSLFKKLTGVANSAGEGGLGINIPLFSDPSNIFKLFTGEAVDIIEWDIPRFDLNVPFEARFGPIPFPPSPLFAKFNVELNAFADFSIGFNTRGIAKTGNFIDGFFFGDLENVSSGFDIDEFGIGLEASLGAAIDVFVAEVGIRGGIRADLAFNWNDLDGDGRIYLDELSDLFLLQPSPAPSLEIPGLCVFDAHGSLSAFVEGYYDIFLVGGGSIDLINEEIFSFNHSCAAPGLAELSNDGTLTLFAGENSEDRSVIYGTSENESFEIDQFTDANGEAVTQVTFNYINRDLEPDVTIRTYNTNQIERIHFDGGRGNDSLVLSENVTTPVRFFGGTGNDIFVGGSGDDMATGGDGNDSLTGNGGNDAFSGGLGNDILNGGDGSDRYVFANAWGRDTVTESVTSVNDVFDFSGVTQSLNVTNGSVVASGSNSVTAENGGGVVGIDRFVAGSGSDTLTVNQVVGNNDSNDWNITGRGRGTINSFAFEAFENLIGGEQNDNFRLSAGGNILGSIDGAGGSNTLDYSGFVGDIRVDRSDRAGNGIASFNNIDVAIGNGGTGLLVGRDIDAVWSVDQTDQGTITDANGEFQFQNFGNLSGGNANDRFVIASTGNLTGRLIGSATPDSGDTDELDLSALTSAVTANIDGLNTGRVQFESTTLQFDDVESLSTSSVNDTIVFAQSGSLDGTLDGAGGQLDHVDLSSWTTGVTIDLAAGTSDIAGFAGIEDITGGSGDDVLTGNGSSNRLFGMGGSDTIDGGQGDNILIGDSATIISSNSEISTIRTSGEFKSADSISAGDGNNLVLPGSGNDIVNLGNGDNFVAGDLTLVTLSGAQVVSMQSIQPADGGDDQITVGTGRNFVIGGNGDDAITVTGPASGVDTSPSYVIGDRGSIELLNGIPIRMQSVFSARSGADTILTSNADDVVIAGGQTDIINVGSGDNFLLADDGAINFTAGVPTSATTFAAVTDGNEDITTGSGNDVIFTGNGDNVVFAGSGDDDIIGGSGIDDLQGGGGDDWIVGMLGDDSIDGGADNDVLFGGVSVGSRADFQFGTSDFTLPPNFDEVEALHPTGYTPSVLITPVIVAGLSIDGDIDDGQDYLKGGGGDDVLFGGSDVDRLEGNSGTDYLDGGAGNDFDLSGGAGDDVVRGGAGNDVLHGQSGIDQVYGDAGDDQVFGDAGDGQVQVGQRLFGGSGRDNLFAYAPAINSIGAFNNQTLLVGDQLFGDGGGDFLHGNARQELLVGGSGNDVIIGDEFVGNTYQTHAQRGIGTESDVNGADDSLFGGSGEDQLYGGGGDDTIFGGSGTDHIEGQDGSDVQYGGAGIDIFILPTALGVGADFDTGVDTIDGHFGNEAEGDAPDDFATDILSILGTGFATTTRS